MSDFSKKYQKQLAFLGNMGTFAVCADANANPRAPPALAIMYSNVFQLGSKKNVTRYVLEAKGDIYYIE